MHDNAGGKLSTHGRSRDWLQKQSTTTTTTAGWNNFYADEKRKMTSDIAQYQKDFVAKPKAEQMPQSISGVFTYYREQHGNVEAVSAMPQPDGTFKRTVIGVYSRSPVNLAHVEESKTKYPEAFASEPQQAPSAPLNGPPPMASSRFFPKGQAATTAPTALPTINVPTVATNENEAPPPAELGLFEHDASQPAKVKFPIIPKVNLPGMKVSLPPRSPGLDKSFNPATAFPPAAPHSRAKPGLMHADDLKAKFGHLNLRAGVDANTKPAFDVTSANARPNGAQHARVAPTSAAAKPLFAVDSSSKPVSKPIAEDECIDHPDHGSKPAVHVPSVPHQNHLLGYSPYGMPTHLNARPHSRYHKSIETTSRLDEAMEVGLLTNAPNQITIKLPGAASGKTVSMSPKGYGSRSPANGGVAGSHGGAARGGRGGYAPRSRGAFNAKFGANHHNFGNAGPNKPRGGSTGASSSSSSPKPRNQWGPRNGPAGPSGQ
jgi:hypothetical protein